MFWPGSRRWMSFSPIRSGPTAHPASFQVARIPTVSGGPQWSRCRRFNAWSPCSAPIATRLAAAEGVRGWFGDGRAVEQPASRAGRGRPGKRLRRDTSSRFSQDTGSGARRRCLAADAWQTITWRDGSNTPLSSRFARWRVRPARGDARRSEPAAEEWLLIEWPEGEAQPDHYWLCTLPAYISLERMVDQDRPRGSAAAFATPRA